MQIVGVVLDSGNKIYNFRNKFEFPVKIGSNVVVRVNDDQVTVGKAVEFKEEEGALSQLSDIIEVPNIKVEQESLKEGYAYVCDIRYWREEYSELERKKVFRWSNRVQTCVYDGSFLLKIMDAVHYQDTDGKVVNLRQLPISKTKKLEYVTFKWRKNKGFFARLFSSK